MIVTVEIDEQTVIGLIRRHINEVVGTEVADKDVRIEVKTKQNYRAEWEVGGVRAVARVVR